MSGSIVIDVIAESLLCCLLGVVISHMPLAYFCDCREQCGGLRQPVTRPTWYRHRPFRERDGNSECMHPVQVEEEPGMHHHVPPVAAENFIQGEDQEIEPYFARPPSPILRSPALSPQNNVLDLGSDDDIRHPAALDDPARAAAAQAPRRPAAAAAAQPPQPILTAQEINRLYTAFLQPLSEVHEVRRAQEFVAAIRAGELRPESCKLSAAQINRLTNPPTELYTLEDGPGGADEDTAMCLRMFLALRRSSQEAYNNVIAAARIRYPESDLLSYERCESLLAEITGIVSIEDDFCVKSCVAFTGPFAELDSCPECGEPRYGDDGKRRAYMTTFPVGPQIQAMHRSEATGEQLDYWTSTSEYLIQQLGLGESLEDLDISDICMGTDVQELLRNHLLTPDDTVLILSFDGAQLYRHRQSSVYMWIFVVANFAPDGRYKIKRVLPGGATPGPSPVKVVESALFRTLQHIVAVNRAGGLRVWDAFRETPAYRARCDAEDRVVREALFASLLFLILATADAAAAPLLSGTVPHHGMHGCRLWCGMPGRRDGHQGRGGHYYPLHAKPDNYNVAGSNHDDQSYTEPRTSNFASYLHDLNRLCKTPQANFATMRRNLGLTKPSPLLGLYHDPARPMMLHLPGTCPLDVMHLCSNLARHLLSLWRGKIAVQEPHDHREDWDFFMLSDDAFAVHGLDVANLRAGHPSRHGRPCRNPDNYLNTGYKSIEFLQWFFVYGPGLWYGVLKPEYWSNYCKLVRGFRILYQYRIPQIQKDEAKEILADFVREFEELYVERNSSRVHFVTQIIHSLIHLAFEAERIGPPSLYAQWVMERSIGFTEEHMRQPGRPYANMFRVQHTLAQLNALKAMFPQFEEQRDMANRIPAHALDLGSGYVLKPKKWPPGILFSQAQRELLRSLVERLRNHGHEVNMNGEKVQMWGNLELPDGDTVRCHLVHQSLGVGDWRDTRNVKIRMDNTMFPFAQVQYFFTLDVDRETRAYAMIYLFTNYDIRMYQMSHRTLIVCQRLQTDDQLRIVSCTDLLSSVSVQPCPTSFGRDDWRDFCFIGERMGPDMAWLQLDDEEDGAELGVIPA